MGDAADEEIDLTKFYALVLPFVHALLVGSTMRIHRNEQVG